MPPPRGDLESYVYRHRMREWIHLFLLFQDLNENSDSPDFRNNTAFHASKRISEHVRVREAVLGPDMTAAMDRFLQLCITLLREEDSVPDLRETLERYGFA
jgi:hypothetical protein